MIEFIEITKKFRTNFWEKDFLALDKVSFRINEGDLVGFLGANGAGKTTLIKILMDFSRADSGQVKFGTVLGSTGQQIKANIGYLPERAYLYQHLTGREFIHLIGAIHEIPRSELNDLIKIWSEKLSIAHALDRHIRGYSKGMQQRLGFLSTIIHKPKLLILDEPLSGLDPMGRRDFKRIFSELNQQGTTVFFSSHIVSDVEEICNNVVFLEKGKLIYEGAIDPLLERHSENDYKLTFLSNQHISTIQIKTEEKDKRINELVMQGAQLLSLEKDKPSLEEIIYKIKK